MTDAINNIDSLYNIDFYNDNHSFLCCKSLKYFNDSYTFVLLFNILTKLKK